MVDPATLVVIKKKTKEKSKKEKRKKKKKGLLTGLFYEKDKRIKNVIRVV